MGVNKNLSWSISILKSIFKYLILPSCFLCSFSALGKWDLIQQFNSPPNDFEYYSMALSPNGRDLVLNAAINDTRFFTKEYESWSSGWEQVARETPNELISSRNMSFSPNGFLAMAGPDIIQIWNNDGKVWRLMQTIDEQTEGFHARLSGRIVGISFSSDGTLASGLSNGEIKFWKLSNNGWFLSQTIRENDKGRLLSLKFHQDQILACGYQNEIVLLELDEGQWRSIQAPLSDKSFDGGPSKIAFSPNGRTLVAAEKDGDVRIWSEDEGEWQFNQKVKNSEKNFDLDLTDMAISPDSTIITTAFHNMFNSEGFISFLKRDETGAWHDSPELKLEVAALGLAFAADGSLIVVSRNGVVSVYKNVDINPAPARQIKSGASS